MRTILVVSLLVSFGMAANGQLKSAREGLMSIRSDIRGLTMNSMWIKDSTVIYECKGHFQFDDYEEGVYEGYDVYKYTYLDLKTRKAQDYLSLSDTASVVSNYIIQSGDMTGWNYFEGNAKPVMDSLQILADTLIDGEILKRIMFEKTDSIYHFKAQRIYYFACNGFSSPIIHINNALEEKFGGCPIRRVEDNVLPRTDFQEFKILRGHLLAEEMKIFSQWKKNAATTTLPVLSYQEVEVKPMFHIKLKNHPVYKQFDRD